MADLNTSVIIDPLIGVNSQQLDDGEALSALVAAPADASAVGAGLPEAQRARIAQFCYTRVHMRELGLRLAATCSMIALRNAFGRAADVVYKQSRDVDATLGALKNGPGGYTPKPVTLKAISSKPTRIDASNEEVEETQEEETVEPLRAHA